MKKNFKTPIKILSSLGIAVALFVSVSEVADAKYLPYGSSSSTVTVNYSLNPTWTTAVDAGRNSWGNSSAPVKVNKSSSSGNKLNASNRSESWYGQNSLTVSGKKVTKFTITLNSRTINRDKNNFKNLVHSVTSHEFGHVFWLADNPTTNSASLMKHNRSRESIRNPQGFDINNVKAKY